MRKLIRQLILEAMKGKDIGYEYEILDNQILPENPTMPSEIANVKIKVVKGKGKGYVFKLSNVRNYENHPLTWQVIDELNTNELISNDIEEETPDIPTIPDNDFQEKELESFQEKDRNTINALFVGDSQTYYPGVSYADKLLSDSRISGKKIAQNGARIEKINDFLDRGLEDETKYDVITIMGGGNNSWEDDPNMEIYDQMYEKAKGTGAFVIAITNPTKENLPDSRKSKYPSNDDLADYVRKSKIPDAIIDANHDLSNIRFFNADRVHLNSTAHDYLKNQWLDIVFGEDEDIISV